MTRLYTWTLRNKDGIDQLFTVLNPLEEEVIQHVCCTTHTLGLLMRSFP